MELSNRERARERLEQYLIASRDYNYYQYRIDTVREEMTHCTSTIGGKSSGNTGKYITEEVIGKPSKERPHPQPSKIAIPVKHIPRIDEGTKDPKRGERLLVAKIDKIVNFENKQRQAVAACIAIENEIDAWCDGMLALVLKYRYVIGLTYTEIARKLNYTERHIRRLVDDALECFGSKMKHVRICQKIE